MLDRQIILDKLQIQDFEPLWWAKKGMQQTLLSHYLPCIPFISNKNLVTIPLHDGDRIIISINTPLAATPPKRIMLLLHGLTGSYLSKYMIRMTQRLTQLGYLVVRMNLRGAGPGKLYAQKLYHAGMSCDLSMVLTYLAKEYPNLPVTTLGFSLGANIALKLAGEPQLSQGQMDSLIAVSPPMDLGACVKLLSKTPNKFLDKYFAKQLIGRVKEMHQRLKLPVPTFSNNLNVCEFDENYTAPYNGFSSASDYYTKSSAIHYLSAIEIPTFILCAKNDPLISMQKYKNIPHKENFDVLLTDGGGHLGWIANSSPSSMRWMDNVIMRWICWFDSKTDANG